MGKSKQAKARKVKGTLVILTLNEREGLHKIFPQIPLDRIVETFAVDGGSTDGTLAFFKEQGVRVLSQRSKGRGEAFRLARDQAKHERLVFFSPDGNEDPRDIIPLFRLLEKGNDMAIASRFMRGARCDEDDQFLKIRKFGNRMFTMMANLIYGGRMTDAINGFRGITKAAWARIRPDAHGFGIEFQMSIRAMKEGLRIREIPTIEKERIGGRSTAGTWKVGMYFSWLLIRELFKRP